MAKWKMQRATAFAFKNAITREGRGREKSWRRSLEEWTAVKESWQVGGWKGSPGGDGWWEEVERRGKGGGWKGRRAAVTGGRIGLKEGEASGGFAVLIVRAFFARAAVGTGTHPKTQETTRSNQLEYVWRCTSWFWKLGQITLRREIEEFE